MKATHQILLWPRDLWLIVFSPVVLVAMAWAYWIDLARDRPELSMQGMAERARIHPWARLDFQLLSLRGADDHG